MFEVGKLKKVKFIMNNGKIVDLTYKKNKRKKYEVNNIKEIICIFKNTFEEYKELTITNKIQQEAFVEYLKENNFKINYLIVEEII